MNRSPNIAVDFDNTLTRSPDALGTICEGLSLKKASVYIITGRQENEKRGLIKRLKELGIDPNIFDDIYCFPGTYDLSKFDSSVLDAISVWKAEMCKKLDIDIIFEDSILVIDPIKKISPKTLISILI